MALDRDKLAILAADRRIRLQSDGRTRFDLTEEEIERSTRTAMRLADASKSRAEARAGASTTLPETGMSHPADQPPPATAGGPADVPRKTHPTLP